MQQAISCAGNQGWVCGLSAWATVVLGSRAAPWPPLVQIPLQFTPLLLQLLMHPWSEHPLRQYLWHLWSMHTHTCTRLILAPASLTRTLSS